ncbi:MAG: heme o synthase [Gammaproteobacteria bacterium]|nr:heme o synthase [Gammaproteobacteria bacterium]
MLSTFSQIPWQDYLTLTKPRVVLLMLLTALIGMQLACEHYIPFATLVFANIGIALASASAAVINQCVDRHIDAKMQRTAHRPLVSGNITIHQALVFAFVLGSIGLSLLYFFINTITAWLTFVTLIGYAVFYTMFLKTATPQNIVIGGAAGAAPPMLGWVAVTGHLDPQALLLMLIIYVWTPPHFWALAIHRCEEYKKAKIPMLPVTHGIRYTKLNILLYSILLYLCCWLPYLVQMSGLFYLISSNILNIIMIYYSIKLLQDKNDKTPWAIKTFNYSIAYLMLLFFSLLIDHWWFILI